jgi:hypothetical protein
LLITHAFFHPDRYKGWSTSRNFTNSQTDAPSYSVVQHLNQTVHLNMSEVAPQSPLLRLPRELRDSIFEQAFPDANTFTNDWNWIGTFNKNALFEKLTGLY